MAYKGRKKDHLIKLVFSFYPVGPRHPTRGSKVGSKCLYLLGHLHILTLKMIIMSKLFYQVLPHKAFCNLYNNPLRLACLSPII